MQVACYCGDATFDGDDIEVIADALVAHVRADHQTQYPEESLRTFVRNYGEATQRLTGPTERLDTIGTIEIHPVSADRIDDWLHFFDHDAFAGDPDWASCYCLEPHQPPSEEEGERPWRTTRAMMADRLGGGGSFGYLAYVDGTAAGWVNASLRSDYGPLRTVDPDGPAPESVIGVSCFVVAPPYRQHGVAAALLDRVIADAATRGATWIEAYPHTDPDVAAEAKHFRGARSMFDARGFEAVRTLERQTVVRRGVG